MRQTLLLIFMTICFSFIHGQNNGFKTYNYNQNNSYTKLNFSFDIPNDWIINGEIDATGYFLNCKPTSDSEAVKYNDCYDGIIFKIKYFSSNLDSALLGMGLQKKSEGMYLTYFNGKIKIVVSSAFKGDTYNGFYYTINNDIICKNDKRHKLAGHFQFIYFSDNKQTICIVTNGRRFDGSVFNQIKDSFKFN